MLGACCLSWHTVLWLLYLHQVSLTRRETAVNPHLKHSKKSIGSGITGDMAYTVHTQQFVIMQNKLHINTGVNTNIHPP